ncbi:MAG TPA: inositol monophosphatase family protein, partial [Burkholderiales bacterium]
MHPMLNIAVRAARRAGSIINRAALDGGGGLKVTSKRAKDFVTQVDQAAEQAIIDIVRKSYPEHGLLAEESGASQADAEFVWIIDPLDGTTNFIHGFPQYCVSIGIRHRGAL